VPVAVTVVVPAVVNVQDSVDVPDPPMIVMGVIVQAELSAARTTSSVNPFTGETATVEVPARPTLVATLTGLAEIKKSGKSATVAELVRHWLGVTPQSKIVAPEGSLTEESSAGGKLT